MYDTKPDGSLDLIAEVPSAREHDAPRHCLPSKDGRFVYSVRSQYRLDGCYAHDAQVTEHSELYPLNSI